MRRRQYSVVSGSLFADWKKIEQYCRSDNQSGHILVVRLKTTDGKKIVGVNIPSHRLHDLIDDFTADEHRAKENKEGDDTKSGIYIPSDDDEDYY